MATKGTLLQQEAQCGGLGKQSGDTNKSKNFRTCFRHIMIFCSTVRIPKTGILPIFFKSPRLFANMTQILTGANVRSAWPASCSGGGTTGRVQVPSAIIYGHMAGLNTTLLLVKATKIGLGLPKTSLRHIEVTW